MDTRAFGLDLGTGRMKKAALDVTGNPVLIPNQHGESSTPAAVFLEVDRALTGTEALNSRFKNESCFFDMWKRELGTGAAPQIGPDGKEWRPVDFTGLYIELAMDDYKRQYGEMPKSVVIAVPANIGQRALQEIWDTAVAKGLEVLKIIHEPTAAALGNGIHKRGDGLYLVLDVGHGTTDVSLVSVTLNDIVVKATRGVEKLGGYDFRMRLRDFALDQFQAQHGFRPEPTNNPMTFQDLDVHVEQAMHMLSTCDSATIVVSCDGKMTVVTVLRDQFKAMCADLVQQMVECLQELAADSGIAFSESKEFLFVGGCARMPMLIEAAEACVGRAPSSHCDPHHAVALGAAIAARLELNHLGRPVVVSGVVLPPARWSLREVLSHDIGVTALMEDLSREILSAILKRNTPIPCEAIVYFRLSEDGQMDAMIQILQGTAGADLADSRVLGQFDLTDLPPVHGTPHVIHIELRIDRNGILHALARDSVSGKVAQLAVDYKKLAATTPAPAPAVIVPASSAAA